MVMSDLQDPLVSREAYILVYRLRSPESASTRTTSTRVTRRSKMSEEPMDTEA